MAKGNTPTPKGNAGDGAQRSALSASEVAGKVAYAVVGAAVGGKSNVTQSASQSVATRRPAEDTNAASKSVTTKAATSNAATTPPPAQVQAQVQSQTQPQSFTSKIPQGWNTQTTPDHPYSFSREYVTNDKVIDTIVTATGVGKAKAKEFDDAIDTFTGASYKSIHKYQMGESQSPAEAAKNAKIVKGMEEYIQRAPKFSGETMRGYTLSNVELDSYIKKVGGNSTISMVGTSSWTSEMKFAESFANYGGKQNKVVLVCKGGQPMGTSIRHLSEYYRESEVLVSEKAKFRITKYNGKDKNGYHRFEVEAV